MSIIVWQLHAALHKVFAVALRLIYIKVYFQTVDLCFTAAVFLHMYYLLNRSSSNSRLSKKTRTRAVPGRHTWPKSRPTRLVAVQMMTAIGDH